MDVLGNEGPLIGRTCKPFPDRGASDPPSGRLDTQLSLILKLSGILTGNRAPGIIRIEMMPETSTVRTQLGQRGRKAITINLVHKVTNPLPMFWPPKVDVDDTGYNLSANSVQVIQF